MHTWVLAVLATLVALLACSDGTAPVVEPSGFLGDYSQLEKGRGDQVQLVYINPEAHFARYDKILLEHAAAFEAEASLSAEEEQSE